MMIKLDKQNVEDILGLAPIQEGLLFHYLKILKVMSILNRYVWGFQVELMQDCLRKLGRRLSKQMSSYVHYFVGKK